MSDSVLLSSLWNSLYCRKQEHKGNGPCDFVATRTSKAYSTVSTTFPRACPASRYCSAVGVSLSL
jgi:hypothetical protein